LIAEIEIHPGMQLFEMLLRHCGTEQDDKS
jgi:hypothetical protein